MSKDLGCKWNFIVRNEASQEQGREDSSFDYFKEKERCLVSANSTSKCKITKCFCKSTPLVLRNSISFLVSH